MEKLTEVLKFFNGGLQMSRLYPAGHPAIINQLDKSYSLASEILDKEKAFTIAMVDDVMTVQSKPLYAAPELFETFLNMLKEKRVERLVFSRGLTRDEMVHFYEVLVSPSHEVEAAGGLDKAFNSRGVTHIVPHRFEKEKKDLLARRIYTDALDVMSEVVAEARLGNVPNADKAKKVVSEMVDVILEDKNAILGLSMIKGFDDYLFYHSVNVSILSVSLGETLEFPESRLNDLGIGALLHDIGKTQTPENIVKKPGHLSKMEWEVMKKHPKLGYDILWRMQDIDDIPLAIALEHHLRYDKRVGGYPENIADKNVNPCSQVVAIADTYDAITTLRPYQRPTDPSEAIRIMEALEGTRLKPDYFRSFVKMLGIYPIGTLVRLDTNEIALICRPNYRKPLRPSVKIIIDPLGKRHEEPVSCELDEVGADGRPLRNIVGTVDPLVKCIKVSDYL